MIKKKTFNWKNNNFTKKFPKPAVNKVSRWGGKNRGSKFKFFDNKNKKTYKKFQFQKWKKPKGRWPTRRYYPRGRYKNKFYFKKTGVRNNYNSRFARRKDYPLKELFLKKFASQTYFYFKKEPGPDKKLAMTNYWKIFREVTGPAFSFTFPNLDGQFYLGVIRSYMSAIKRFIKSFFARLMLMWKRGEVRPKAVLKGFYGVYKVHTFITYLAKLYDKPLKKPDYYFRGYRTHLRACFFRHLTIFCMKIFILVNRVFSDESSTINSYDSFFRLWKRIYKDWLNVYYQEIGGMRNVVRLKAGARRGARLLTSAVKARRPGIWRNLFKFRQERIGYKRTLLRYFFKYAYGNYKTSYPFSYRKKKHRFKYNIFGKRIYLQRKRLFRRKSRKYIRWFRTLVTGGYYFSSAYAEKTFYKAGYGRRAWMSRRRARHVFKMKFVFIRYFSKKFGLKNRTAFLRKAEHVARKGGNKWLRYYREFESRLVRVLVLFGLSSNDETAKNFISNNWVFVNKKIFNDHNHKVIPRVKMGDLVSLANSAAPYFLKKKFKFFKKRLSFFDRGEEAKLVYALFKKFFSEWMVPSIYYINGTMIRHGLSALMSGPVVTNSRAYFKINRFIPFFNRTLFKIFIQRFTKKLN